MYTNIMNAYVNVNVYAYVRTYTTAYTYAWRAYALYLNLQYLQNIIYA